jgi:tetratricopeptide (TPR) repeat protein
VLAADPNNRRARQGLADAYIYGGKFNDAVKIYDQLVQANPNDTALRVQRARALGYAGRSREAITALRPIVAAEPNNIQARLVLAEAGVNSGNPGLLKEGIAQYRQVLATDSTNVPARIGLARGLSYQGKYSEAKANLNQVLAANPNNVDARYALAETQRFQGQAFDARDNYRAVLAAQPNNAQAKAGLRETRRDTASALTLGGSYYSDTNGVRLRSFNPALTFRTRAGVLGILAEQGRFSQNGVERDRRNIGILLGKNFGAVQTSLILSRLKYDGAPNRTLWNLNFNRPAGPRRRFYGQFARQDVFESNAAVVAGITADIYRLGFTQPLGDHFDLEGQGTYFRYSDDNRRIQLIPSLYYRFRPTNPSLRVGLGYMYDDTDELRAIYYTPQTYKAT